MRRPGEAEGGEKWVPPELPGQTGSSSTHYAEGSAA